MLQCGICKTRRALGRGYRAWLAGNLGGAVKDLRKAHEFAPGSPGSIYYLARVLSEQDRPDEALSAIEEAIAKDPGSSVGRVFRAIVLYDHKPTKAAREALAPLMGGNLLARAFDGLLHLRERLLSRATGSTGSFSLSFPLAARWIGDVTGRALALLEESFHRDVPADSIEFHHTLFATRSPSPSPPSPLPSPSSAREWTKSVDEAFRGSNYEVVQGLCDLEGARPWLTPATGVFQVFSLLATGNESKALTVVSRFLQEDFTAGDFHFLRGLCHARLGQVKEAGWSFARAARLLDTEVDEVVREVSRRLGVRWDFEDS